MKRGMMLWILINATACSRPDQELPSLSVTNWTDRLELFMEYPTVIVNREALFAVHLTDLETFEPLTTGSAVLELQSEQGSSFRFEAAPPSRPGIYRVVATVTTPGRYHMWLHVAEPADRHDLGEVTVFSNEQDAIAAYEVPSEPEPTIAFLKEQQWVTDFRTEKVQKRSLRRSVRVPAEVRPRTGGEARVLSPVGGRLLVEGALLAPGSRVRQGQILARIAPRAAQPEDRASLALAVAESEAELDLARRNRQRMERLVGEKAVPARRLEEARRDEAVAEARQVSAQKRLGQLEETLRSGGGGSDESFIKLAAPLSGVLVTSGVTPGATVEEGEEVFHIIDPSSVFVIGAVPEADAARMRQSTGVELHVPGRSEPLILDGERGVQVSMGAAVDRQSRTVPVVYRVENRDGILLVGQAVRLVLVTEETLSALSVPTTALVDEGNQSVAYVQVGGESFARRALEIGIRDRSAVQVLSGLQEGERVVSRGAYEVRLASLSGQIPAEGHVH